MNIIYLSQARLPSSGANSVHVTKMCSALSHQSNQVTLVGYAGESEHDIYTYYCTSNQFQVKTFDIKEAPGESISLAFHSLIWVLWNLKTLRPDLIYSRSAICLYFCLLLNIPFIYEVHSTPRTRMHRLIENRILSNKRLQKIAFISQQLKSWYLDSFHILDDDKCILLPDAADDFDPPKQLPNLPGQSCTKIGYIGHLYPGKGGDKIIDIAKTLPNIDFHLVGGLEKDLERLKRKSPSKNVYFHGHVPYKETKAFLNAFDIVLAPYEKKVSLAKTNVDIGQWMSPLKLFEYMSAKKPIISSDLPVLREVLKHEVNALLADPNDIDAWTKSIERLVHDPTLRNQIASQAHLEFKQHYSWSIRAKKIINAINH